MLLSLVRIPSVQLEVELRLLINFLLNQLFDGLKIVVNHVLDAKRSMVLKPVHFFEVLSPNFCGRIETLAQFPALDQLGGVLVKIKT